MAFNLLPIKIPPGMYRNGTNYEAMGRWWDGDMVRWQNGRLKPIGGWASMMAPGASLTGIARGIIASESDLGGRYIFVGTEQKLYVGQGGIFTDITPTGFATGRTDSVAGLGYGAGPYGGTDQPGETPVSAGGTYGTQRTGSGLQLSATTWAMDNYGQDTVFCASSDNKIYQYDPVEATCARIANSPTALSVMVTNEDYILALGSAGVGRQIQWPDLNDTTNWAPLVTNSAGSIPLNTGSVCVAGARVGVQNLVWTASDVHAINYIGTPGIYGPTRLAEGCGLVGPNAWAATDVAMWWSYGGFFTYNGIVQPMVCDVQDYIWRVVDWTQTAKIYCEINSMFNEVTWYFPSIPDPDPLTGVVPPGENDSYVTYNYKENLWYFGIKSMLGRRTAIMDRGVWPLPIGVDPQGIVYQHETGYLANGATRVGQVFAQSGPVEIQGGNKVTYVDLVIPDVSPSPDAVDISVTTQMTPSGPVSTIGPAQMIPNSEGYFPIQFAGRQAAFKIDSAADEDWSLGTMRVNNKQRGSR